MLGKRMRTSNATFLPMMVVIILVAVFLFAYRGGGNPVTVDQSFLSDEKLMVHILDVGQADSILIQSPKGRNVLIDGGNRDDGSFIVKYLKKVGVNKLDFIIATHPHEDHIGGLPYIIKEMPVGTAYMPRVTTTTQIFEDLMKALKDKGLTANQVKAGVVLPLNDDIKGVFLAPISDQYDDLNQYSAVLKLQYGKIAFLFMGDAGVVSEQEMLQTGADLKADVIKIGHHGSSDASSDAFLNAVNPKIAAISVGRNNDYGHPDKAIIDRLEGRGTTIYRTDINGIIRFVTDGQQIEVTTSRN